MKYICFNLSYFVVFNFITSYPSKKELQIDVWGRKRIEKLDQLCRMYCDSNSGNSLSVCYSTLILLLLPWDEVSWDKKARKNNNPTNAEWQTSGKKVFFPNNMYQYFSFFLFLDLQGVPHWNVPFKLTLMDKNT